MYFGLVVDICLMVGDLLIDYCVVEDVGMLIVLVCYGYLCGLDLVIVYVVVVIDDLCELLGLVVGW